MEVGSIIEADVLDAKEGFALLRHGSMKATLMQTELTWSPLPVKVTDFVAPGDKVVVRVTAICGDRFSASLKRVRPDPWDSPIQVGQVIRGRVTKVTEYGCLVLITWYCQAILKISDSVKKNKLNDQIMVRVSEVDLERQRVLVEEAEFDIHS